MSTIDWETGYDEGYRNGVADGEGVGEGRGIVEGRRLEHERGVEVTYRIAPGYGYGLSVTDGSQLPVTNDQGRAILIPLEAAP